MREESHDLLSRFLSLFDDDDDDFYDERRNFARGEECCSLFCDFV
jgi:hypothetical protein